MTIPEKISFFLVYSSIDIPTSKITHEKHLENITEVTVLVTSLLDLGICDNLEQH